MHRLNNVRYELDACFAEKRSERMVQVDVLNSYNRGRMTRTGLGAITMVSTASVLSDKSTRRFAESALQTPANPAPTITIVWRIFNSFAEIFGVMVFVEVA
jgi:hypothetical protein